MFEKSQRIFKCTAEMPFLLLGYPKSCFPFALVVLHLSLSLLCGWRAMQESWQHLQCPTFHGSHLGSPPRLLKHRQQNARQRKDGWAAPEAGIQHTAPGWRGASAASAAGSASLPGFGSSGAATTWGESEGHKQRLEAPCTPCHSLPCVNRWCLRSSTKLHRSKAASILSYWW